MLPRQPFINTAERVMKSVHGDKAQTIHINGHDIVNIGLEKSSMYM